MPFGKAKRTVAQDVQALDHVRGELLALRGEVSALRTEKRLKDAFIATDEADMKKRLEQENGPAKKRQSKSASKRQLAELKKNSLSPTMLPAKHAADRARNRATALKPAPPAKGKGKFIKAVDSSACLRAAPNAAVQAK